MIAVDTNVLGYSEGLDGPERQDRANAVLGALKGDALILPLQVVCELHRLVMRRHRINAADAAEIVERWTRLIPRNPPTLPSTVRSALELTRDHSIQIFDAVILAASAEAGCHILLTEDLHHGFVWRGVTVVNPFREPLHPMLADRLRD